VIGFMTHSVGFEVGSVREEFEGVALRDPRRRARLLRIVDRLVVDPAQSFPKALVSVGELEGSYRFFGNESVSPDDILAPHRERTWARAKNSAWVLSLEDTTELRFGGASWREGLGELMQGGHGFFLHTSMLAALDEGADRAVPLGVPAYEVLVRTAKPKRTKEEASSAPDKESLRWARLMAAVDEGAAAHGQSVVHVGDREAGQYDLLAAACARGGRFVVRIQSQFGSRGVRTPGSGVSLTRSVAVSAKMAGRGKRRAPDREHRIATLRVEVCGIEIPMPNKRKRPLELPMLHLVEVRETDPPEGVPPVHWTLLTTEPVDTEADIARIVDSYRARWLIEEFFKALKTGCAMESRQLESRAALENALAVFIPMAWHMLLLRGVVRDAPATRAEQLVSPRQFRLLQHIAKPANNQWGIRLGSSPDATELLFAIARMGGHLRNNGTPGWLTIRRGMDELYRLEMAATALGVEM
jgi:hypothetical protein